MRLPSLGYGLYFTITKMTPGTYVGSTYLMRCTCLDKNDTQCLCYSRDLTFKSNPCLVTPECVAAMMRLLGKGAIHDVEHLTLELRKQGFSRDESRSAIYDLFNQKEIKR